MKLADDFFHVLDRLSTENGFSATIRLNPDHVVYTGHFPGFPVTPGVIQLQIVHELLEAHLGRKIKLKILPQCKFLRVLNPKETPQITVETVWVNREGLLHLNATGSLNEVVFFRFTAVYEPRS